MRLLTPLEQREIEQLKAEVNKLYGNEAIEVVIPFIDREKWLNILDIVINAQEAMKLAWRQSSNPNIDLVQIVRGCNDD